MPGVTKEQIARAKEWDLLSYMQAYEPQELVRCGGREYSTASHGSLKISNGRWNWHSRGIGGRTALDYLIKVRGMGFVEAVEALSGERAAEAPGNQKRQGGQDMRKPFSLPAENRYGTAAVSYLQSRGIDAGIISRCIGEGILYEGRQRQNCVFVGRDPKGQARYACLRGIRGAFKGDVEGSDKRYGFHLPPKGGGGRCVAAAESPIDALSVATLLKQQGEEWEKNHYLSLGGTAPRALIQFLRDHPETTHVSLCLDNDRAGRLGMAKIREAIAGDGELCGRIQMVVDNPPPGWKDYNGLLMQKTAFMQRAKQEERAGASRGGMGI